MRFTDLARLVRLPAALSVPGDTLAGASAAGRLSRPGTWALPAASACMYWAGMALNDYADRELDAVERPERPIPSGAVRPGEALAVAAGLTAAGVGVAAAGGGRHSAITASALAATVWGYDLALKPTRFAPLGMAVNRGLDVLMGAGDRPGAALRPALVMAAHTYGVTSLSRGEVYGTRPSVAAGALACTVGSAAAAAAPTGPGRPSTRRGAWGQVLSGLYAGVFATQVGRAQAHAVARPVAANAGAATGTGIRGMIPLQAALLARSGAPCTATGLVVGAPLAKAASGKVAIT
ncbi:SCO3242 family prenyltransferase [Nocardiopsis salina]|uniref:SCO3242 family prenyltransferase n=1 Tax=Nocardiopsis salina TaxID=245836 RepID=UPI0003462408|nr:UbiA family prenyltransferase [Nocardiopsis salina]